MALVDDKVSNPSSSFTEETEVPWQLRKRGALKGWEGCALSTLNPSVILCFATGDCLHATSRAACNAHLTVYFVCLSNFSSTHQTCVMWLQMFVCRLPVWVCASWALNFVRQCQLKIWAKPVQRDPMFPLAYKNPLMQTEEKAGPWNYKITSLLLHSLSVMASYLVLFTPRCDLTLRWCRPNGGLEDERSDWWGGGEQEKKNGKQKGATVWKTFFFCFFLSCWLKTDTSWAVYLTKTHTQTNTSYQVSYKNIGGDCAPCWSISWFKPIHCAHNGLRWPIYFYFFFRHLFQHYSSTIYL